jgi:hypothetical protein
MEKIYLSEYASEIRYIPMEVDLNYLLGFTSEFYADFSEDYILESDGRICLLYDNTGHFLRQIGEQGRGPGEYTGMIYRIFLRGDKIYLQDMQGLNLLEYRTDGSFLERQNNILYSDENFRMTRDIYVLNDSLIIGQIETQTGHEECMALLFDKNGAVIEYYKNYTRFKLEYGVRYAFSSDAVFHKFGNTVYFKHGINDTLFRLDVNNQLQPAYVFNLGKYGMPVSDRGKNDAIFEQSSYIQIRNVFQTKNYIVIVCGYGDNFPASRLTPIIVKSPSGKDAIIWKNTTSVVGVYEKETDHLALSEPTNTDNHLFTSGFYNDIDAGPRFIPEKMINDSMFVMKLNFNYLVEHVESNDFKNNIPKNPEQKEKLATLVDSLKNVDFDNPVYMLVTFKN